MPIYTINAQVKHDYNWMFGYAGGENHPDYGLTQINFNQSPVSIEKTGGNLWIYTSNLYTSSSIELFQIDTEAEDLVESMLLIGEYDGFRSPFSTTFYQQQLGPDCRIYMNAASGVDKLHVINYPDRRGEACDFQQHSVDLPTFNQISLTHFPNYRLGVEPTYPCDSTIVLPMMTTAIERSKVEQLQVKCYPNPARDVFYVEIANRSKNTSIQLFNSLGIIVAEKRTEGKAITTFATQHFPTGIYYISVIEDETVIAQQKIVVAK